MRTIKTYFKGAPFYIAPSSRNVAFGLIPSYREPVPPQPVGATPSAINLFSKGGVYDARETSTAFRDAANRPVEPLEGGTVVASDWAGLRKEPCVHSVCVVAARWDCSGRPSALAAYAYAAGAGGHLSRNCLRLVDS